MFLIILILIRLAVDKAVSYLEKDELPPHWDRDALFGSNGMGDDDDDDSDSEVRRKN